MCVVHYTLSVTAGRCREPVLAEAWRLDYRHPGAPPRPPPLDGAERDTGRVALAVTQEGLPWQ